MSGSLDLSAAAQSLYGADGSQPSPAATSKPIAEPTNLSEAGRRLFGESQAGPEVPATRDCLDGISLFGDRDQWASEIERAYGADLDVAQRLAAVGLVATSTDPGGERAYFEKHGCSPARFAELVEAGRRVGGVR